MAKLPIIPFPIRCCVQDLSQLNFPGTWVLVILSVLLLTPEKFAERPLPVRDMACVPTQILSVSFSNDSLKLSVRECSCPSPTTVCLCELVNALPGRN